MILNKKEKEIKDKTKSIIEKWLGGETIVGMPPPVEEGHKLSPKKKFVLTLAALGEVLDDLMKEDSKNPSKDGD